MFNTDKMKDLTPLDVVFTPGESPTAQKLQGMQEQDANAIRELEMAIGDMYNNSGHTYSWLNTLARMIGNSDDLNPVILPSYEENDYIQNLTAGKSEHELDLIPVGVGAEIIKESYDSSVDPMAYKNDVSLLVEEGDWTITQAQEENGNQKNEKRIVTHSPSTGGYIIFNKVTTGKGSIDEHAKHSLIPTLAQAKTGGPYVTMSLSSAASNTYVLTLPDIKTDADISGNPVDVSLSNTKTHIVTGRKYEFPHYFFSIDGLDLASDDTTSPKPEKIFPLNVFQIYNWDTKEKLSGIIEVRASVINIARKYQVYVRFQKDIQVDVGARYIVAVSGNSITQYIKALSRFMIEHKHAGNDMVRHIAHKDLLGLRTASVDTNNRSSFYGPSSIDANDHSMYFHRNGFTSTDKGAGGNVIRGDVVVGSKVTGHDDAIHENYNVLADSNALVFGNHANGGKLFHEKINTHKISISRKNVPRIYSGPALKMIGSLNPTLSCLQMYLLGNLRITGDVVLGTDANNAVIIPGDLYLKRSLTLIPSDDEIIPMEAGSVRYSQKAQSPVFHNGIVEVPLGRTGCEILVGTGTTSFGKHNGTNAICIQAAIDEAAVNGGIVKILRGEYNVGLTTITIPQNVEVRGEGKLTIVKGTGTIFLLNGQSAKVGHMIVTGESAGAMATYGVVHNTSETVVENIQFIFCQTGQIVNSIAQRCVIGAANSYVSCTSNLSYEGTPHYTNKMIVYKPVGHTNDYRMANWSDKATILKNLKATSGIAMIYDESPATNSIGKGAFKVTGTGTIVYDDFMPVSPYNGVGGNIDAWKIGTEGTISVGAKCFDQNYVELGNVTFITTATDLAISMNHYWGIAVDGGSGFKLTTNTRFIKPYISITKNNNGIYFDGFEIYPMSVARVAAYMT